jgi:hypothetical protein
VIDLSKLITIRRSRPGFLGFFIQGIPFGGSDIGATVGVLFARIEKQNLPSKSKC